ncbi:spatacsin [Rhinophrynus dorsalis]
MDLSILLVPGLFLQEKTNQPSRVSLTRHKNLTLCSLYPHGELRFTTLPSGNSHISHTHLDGPFTQYLWEDADGSEDVSYNCPRLLTLFKNNKISVNELHPTDGHLDLTMVYHCDEDTLKQLCADNHVDVYDTVDGSHVTDIELPPRQDDAIIEPLSSIRVSPDLDLAVVSSATSWALPVRLSEGFRSWDATLSSLSNETRNLEGPFRSSLAPSLWPGSTPLKLPLSGTPVGGGWLKVLPEGYEGPVSFQIWSVSSFSALFCLLGSNGDLTMIHWHMESQEVTYHPLGKALCIDCTTDEACLVITDRGLSLVLFAASQDEFLTRLMIHGSASTADTLCHLNNWGRCSVPIHTLEAGLDNRQLDTVDFFLKSKESILCPLTSRDSPAGIQSERYLKNVQDLQPALDLLSSCIRGTDQETQSKHFSEQLLQLMLRFLNGQLQMLCTLLSRKVCSTLIFLNGQLQMLCTLLSESDPVLEQCVGIFSRYITQLRPFMKRFLQQPLPMQVPHVERETHTWKDLSVEHIISDAILSNRILEAQEFLRVEGHHSPSLAWVKREGLKLVYRCLQETHVQEACQLLQNMGYSIWTELKRICLHTSDQGVRTVLVNILQREGYFSAQEQEVIRTVSQIEELYCNQGKRAGESHDVVYHRPLWQHCSSSQESVVLQLVKTTVENGLETLLLHWAQDWDVDTQEAIMLPLRDFQDLRLSNPCTLWRHLTLWHNWPLISSWIECLGQWSKSGDTGPSLWPCLTPAIVDENTMCCNYTRQKVLDKLARIGVFVPSELQDFESLVERLAVSKGLMSLAATSLQNTAPEEPDLHTRFILLCAEHGLQYLLYTYLDYHSLDPQLCSALSRAPFQEALPWFGFLVQIREVQSNPEDPTRIFHASLSNAHMMMPGDQPSVNSMLLEGHTLLALATNMYAPGGFDRVLKQNEEPEPSHGNIDLQLLKMALAPYPKLKAALFSHHSAPGSSLDIPLYHLMQALPPFNPTHFFTWQAANTLVAGDTRGELPHCSQPGLVSKLSMGEQLDVCFLLRSGRPAVAFATFLVQQLLRSKTPHQLMQQAAEDVYSLALSCFHVPSVVASCVSFLELLGLSSHKLRVDVNTANLILRHTASAQEEAGQKSHALAQRLTRLVENEAEAARDLSASLEESVSSILQGECGTSSTVSSVSWVVVQQFCLLHSIPMSSRYLQDCAQRQDWLQLLVHTHTQEQISCLLGELSPAIGSHMALALKGMNSDTQVTEYSLARFGSEPSTASLYHVLLQSQQKGQPGRVLLKECIIHRAPLLSVLAACVQDTDLIFCLCVWIVTSLTPAMCAEITCILQGPEDHEWNLQDLACIWNMLLARKESRTLHKAFSIFLEDCPLLLLLEMYELCLHHKKYLEAEQRMQDFQICLLNLQSVDDAPTPLIPMSWLQDRASQLLQLLLLQSRTPYELRKVLQLLCDSGSQQLCGGIDIHKLSSLAQILHEHAVSISKDLLRDYSSAALRVECQRLMQILQDEGYFTLAQRVAELAELPTDSLVIEEVLQDQRLLKDIGQWESPQSRTQYWRKCHQTFSFKQLSPAAASSFFNSQASSLSVSLCPVREQSEALAEQELLFTLAGHWLSLDDCASLASLEKLEQQIWMCRIAQEVASKHGVPRPLGTVLSFTSLASDFAFSSLPVLNHPSLLAISSLPPLSGTQEKLDNDHVRALSTLIDCLLDESCVHEASRVCRYFQLPHRDLWLVLNCRALATGETTWDKLHPDIQAILTEGREVQENIWNRRKRLQSSSSLEATSSSLPSDPVLTDLEILKDKCAHGKTYCLQLLCVYELSKDLGCSFSDVASRDAGEILRSLLSCHRPELSDRAQAVISSHGLSSLTVAQIVAEEGLKGWRALGKEKGQAEVYNTSERRGYFLQLAKLCQDPTLVGLTLLDCLQNVPLTEPHCIVELLISAHDCFSLTCHLEGIRRVLQACRHLTEIHLAPNQEYSLMVRLLSGIGRYNDMVYVFDILHKNQHFEVLLRKQLDTKGGLQTALLEYIKRCHPGDSEKHNMTALCFSLHRDIGHNHEHAALIQLRLIQSRPWEYWMSDLVELRSAIMKALTLLIDAAESYSKDSCVRQSLRCARLTRLLTLQLHLLNSGHQTKLINLDRETLVVPILALPRFYQAVIVTEAYDLYPDWAEVLYHKVILGGDFQYLEEFRQREALRSGMFEQISNKCKVQPPGTTGLQNLKRTLSYCEDTYTRYRLAFENHFYDVTDVLMRDSQTRCCLTDMLSR